jgi:hypothetical protein
MAYYIFLKSLRSLEEFRKNPHVKIPPKSPSTNFQNLGKFKNPIFNSEILFLAFGPADLTARLASGLARPPAAPSLQAEIIRPAHPARASVASSWEIRFPFRIMPSRADRLSLVSLSTRPHLSDSPPSPCRPTPAGNPPRLGCPRAFTALPHHSSPLIPFKPSLNEP